MELFSQLYALVGVFTVNLLHFCIVAFDIKCVYCISYVQRFYIDFSLFSLHFFIFFLFVVSFFNSFTRSGLHFPFPILFFLNSFSVGFGALPEAPVDVIFGTFCA